ncbi:MAG: hypothetical protein QXO84_00790 [Candidatus Aenigmatarchaeota archaeon]
MKGINFMIELAISIILIFSIFYLFTKNVEKKDFLSKQKYEIFQALEILDQSNNLRPHALRNEANIIKEKLSYFSPTKNYSVVIFNKTTNTTEIPNIESRNVAIVDYLIAGDFGLYEPRIIKVFIWD